MFNLITNINYKNDLANFIDIFFQIYFPLIKCP
ncbi:MAG: hypothetical protein JWR38_550 [Mucilaginibacter sp.]|nr:hypothetical protein [Mucilaginibacter sp.]